MKVDKKIIKKNSNWNFKGNVYKYFDKHIKKSIPFYSEAQNLYAQYTDFFLQDKSKIIDLGSFQIFTFVNLTFFRFYLVFFVNNICKSHPNRPFRSN